MAKYFEVTILGSLSNQLVVNRLNFVSNNDEVTTANAISLLRALGYDTSDPEIPVSSSVFHRLLQAQTTGYQMNEIIARNLWSVTDFVTQPVTGTSWRGEIVIAAGDKVPSFVASKLRTNRVRTDIRRGTLALTGGTEEMIDDAGDWVSSYVTVLDAVCTALNTPPSWTSGGATTNFVPSVFKKEDYVVPGSDPVRKAYRYYTDFALFQANIATPVTWSSVARVTSQVSRKIGRGA
jgi:hypothetical protein